MTRAHSLCCHNNQLSSIVIEANLFMALQLSHISVFPVNKFNASRIIELIL